MTASVPMLRETALLLRQLQYIKERYPMALYKCWDAPSPKTSQKRAIEMALTPRLMVALISGGNRSGKTASGAQIAVAFMLGREHKMVKAWAKLNGFDTSGIQKGPGRVVASSLSWNESIQVLRPSIAKLLPQNCKWSGGHIKTQGQVEVMAPGGGVIIFKCKEQGAEKYQSDSWNLLWLDEEHPEDVYSEGTMRLVDRSGLCLMTMTPLKGRTWVWRRFVKGREEGSKYCQLNSLHNPHIPAERMAKRLANYSEHEKAARGLGEFTALEGRVYTAFSRSVHVVESFRPPDHWPRYMSIDFGLRNPCSIHWYAEDPKDSVLHVYREHYQAGWTIAKHAEHILDVELCAWCEWDEDCARCDGSGRTEPRPEVRVADAAGLEERTTLNQEYGISTVPARKDVRPGINAVCELLALDEDSKPHIVVHDCCPHMIDEFEGYLWSTTKSKANDPDMPLKKNDHAMDELRYLVFWLKRGGMMGFSAGTEPG